MKSGHHFFVPLESARGIAALIVAAFHVSQTPIIVGRSFPDAIIDPNIEHGIWYPVAYVIRLLTEGGGPTVTGPVLFFYILSGFVLTLSLQSKPDLGMSSSADFLVSRVFRIIPATAFTIAMFCLLYVSTGYHLGPVGSYEPSMLLKNAVLLNASIDGVTWSLQTEMIGSVLVLVTAILYRFCGIGIVVAIGLVLAVMSF
jgi:peptidoglycan/LPS O-acetylase OafA/YrhL